MQTSAIIRTVKESDHDVILAITRDEFPEYASIDSRIEEMVGGVSWHLIKSAKVKEELENRPEACAVAEYDGKVVGYVSNVIDTIASRGVISNLAVTSKMQGRGIGRQLIEWSLNLFRSLNLKQAKIETLETNKSGAHLYPKLGFREVVRQIHYVMPL